MLRFSNRPFYIDGDTLPAFTRATGIAVEYHEDQRADTLFSRRDLVVVEDQVAGELIRQEQLDPFDAVLASMRPELVRPGPLLRVPWAVTVTGLAVTRAAQDARSVASLFDPAFAGRAALVRSATETVGLLMRTGGDIDDALTRIGRARQAGQVVVVDSVYDAGLGEPGGAVVAVGNAADVAQLRAEGVDVSFVLPDEGGVLWSDDMVMPRFGSDVEVASRFVEFVYRPDVSRRLFAALPFVSPVEGVGRLPSPAGRLRDLTDGELRTAGEVLGS